MTAASASQIVRGSSATGMDSHAVALELIRDKRVAVAPGISFGKLSAGQVRVSVASKDADVREGVRRICDFVAERAERRKP